MSETTSVWHYVEARQAGGEQHHCESDFRANDIWRKNTALQLYLAATWTPVQGSAIRRNLLVDQGGKQKFYDDGRLSRKDWQIASKWI
ncbi:MAG: hypothetical protein M3R15_11000 [Acidobacteriota bacterium]|nr:hypothetical protein [Acidobacteriota bacterium]